MNRIIVILFSIFVSFLALSCVSNEGLKTKKLTKSNTGKSNTGKSNTGKSNTGKSNTGKSNTFADYKDKSEAGLDILTSLVGSPNTGVAAGDLGVAAGDLGVAAGDLGVAAGDLGVADAISEPLLDADASVAPKVNQNLDPVPVKNLNAKEMITTLQALNSGDPSADAMTALSQSLRPESGHRKFYNPIKNPLSAVSGDGGKFYGDRESWGSGSRYEVEDLNKSTTSKIGQSKIDLYEDDFKTKVNGRPVFLYTYSNYRTRPNDPVVGGELLGIKNENNKTIMLSGYLRIEIEHDKQEYITLTFGKQTTRNSDVYTHDVIVDENNKPQEGIFTVKYDGNRNNPSSEKSYDLANLSNEDKEVLKYFTFLNIESL